ncbi:MAG: restriction endonuclease [Nitrospirota bacterium]|nr:restriction endonuclease [Nitrospirota bacterium]
MAQQAFVLRISPNGIDGVPEALASNQIIIGWAEAKGLLNENLSWEKFRTIVSDTYYADQENMRKASAASGHLWRFIREMNIGDLLAVPCGSDFYVAEVSDPATYDESKVKDDTAYRRNVNWLNDKKPIPRSLARSALISRMKTQGTCAYASDLLPEIKECLEIAKTGSKPAFQSDLQSRLIRETLDEIRSGRIHSYGFENLIHNVLVGLGAVEARIVPRSQDKGADIVATFKVAGAFRYILAVQAKHWQPEPPVGKEVVEQLINGIEAESANLGMIVTSGTVSEEAVTLAEQFFEDKGIKIELVDGDQFAKLIVEHGIKSS